jgi:YjbE family integral membrane protein
MEVLAETAFWLGLGKIIWVDLLLSGDNAVVIALAVRSLPAHQQRRAILLGAGLAILMRVLLTLFAVELLQLPYLKLVGAILLLWIGVKLLSDDGDGEGSVRQGRTMWSAVKTILMADFVMSLDNVMGVAGAAASAPTALVRDILVLFGLGASIPIVIWGSGVVLKIMERFPTIITLGAMLLGWIAGEMLAVEAFVAEMTKGIPQAEYGIAATGAVLVLIVARLIKGSKNAPVGERDL